MKWEPFSESHYNWVLSVLWNDYTAADSLYFEDYQKYGSEVAEKLWGDYVGQAEELFYATRRRAIREGKLTDRWLDF